MNKEAALNKWQSQLKKGFIELCVMMIIRQNEKAYGLEILNSLNDVNLNVTEGTLYPLLNRMNQNLLLDSSWLVPEGVNDEKATGHPKKYYSLGENSEELLDDMLKVYELNTLALKKLMN